jgi:iron complex transport system ATP-binding protein
LIEASGISFCYHRDEWVFRDYTFSVGAGEVLAVLGPNGRGKTTLLKSLMGLLEPKEGIVSLGGPYGYVPQSHGIPFSYSVLDMVVMGRARHIGMFSTPAASDMEAARRALARLAVEDFAERAFNKLSAGERQLVLIARALASECRILILDEPTASLDFQNQGRILRTLNVLARDDNMSIIVATHVPQHAALIASHVLLMYGPHDYLFGPAADAMTEATLSRLYNTRIRELRVQDGDGEVVVLLPTFPDVDAGWDHINTRSNCL